MSIRSRLTLVALLLGVVVLLSWWLATLLGVSASWIWLAALAAICVGTAVLFVAKITTARKLILRSQDGVALLNQGRAAEALAMFDACSKTAQRAQLRHYHRLFEANRAAALIHLGDTDEASRICRQLTEDPESRRSLAASWGHFVAIAASAELLGPTPNLDDVARWLEQHGADLLLAQQPVVFGARAILLLRRTRYAEVDNLLEARWTEAEAVLPARQLRMLQLLWAFALHRHGREDDATAHLVAAGTNIADEHPALIRHWPELAEFIGSAGGYRSAGRA